MGHDIEVHREFYRLPEETLQMAKISRILFALQSGISQFKGKSLEDIIPSIDSEEDTSDSETEDAASNKMVAKEDPLKKGTATVSQEESAKITKLPNNKINRVILLTRINFVIVLIFLRLFSYIFCCCIHLSLRVQSRLHYCMREETISILVRF